MTQINVKLTPTYTLTADADNFVILTRKVIDPTKAPGYDANSGKSTETRVEWKDPKYFSLTSAGLAAALDYVRIRTVANSGIRDLSELVAMIRDTTQDITDALREGVKSPNISVVVTSEE